MIWCLVRLIRVSPLPCEHPDVDCVSVTVSADETTLEAGIRVQIHSQDEPPYIHELGFGVSPGFQTFVSCQEQRVRPSPEPYITSEHTPSSKENASRAFIYSRYLFCHIQEILNIEKDWIRAQELLLTTSGGVYGLSP